MTRHPSPGTADAPPDRLVRETWWRRWFGSRAERHAADFLRRLGYRLLARNYATRLGELDLIALDRGCLVVAEVRSTSTADPARAAASVDALKQKRLTRLALAFVQRYRLFDTTVRFDVLAVSWPDGHAEPQVVHHRHAFEAVGRFQMTH